MADRSHLTPVPTTDKRGRATTVYRNLAARLRPGRGKGSAPIPAAATPSRAPGELDTGIFGDDLAAEMVETGKLPKTEADRILYSLGEHGNGYLLDALRICAQLRATGAAPAAWGEDLAHAVNGLRADGPDGPAALRTQRDVVEAAAVVAFVLRVPRLRTVSLRSGGARGTTVHRIAHPGLEAVIRLRPRDLDRIIAYAEDRGMEPRTPVRPLIQWLDSDVPIALRDGEL